MSWKFLPSHAPGQAAMAPSSIDSEASGTIDASVGAWTVPVPWHVGHMPAAVLGEKWSESRRPTRSTRASGYSPHRENNRRTEFDTVEKVPTVERAPPAERACSSATLGGSPSTRATFGSTAPAISRRAKGATDSRYRRCASPWIVPNAREDLPDPETPVIATRQSRGSSTST